MPPPFVTTPDDVVDRMLHMAELRAGELVFDLGCGDGRIVIAAAQQYGCRAIGCEIDGRRVAVAHRRVIEAKVEHLVRIERANFFDVDLTSADAVMLYLLPHSNVGLLPQLNRLKLGARVVSHEFDFDGIRPDRVWSYTSTEDDYTRLLLRWTAPMRRS